MLKPRLFGSLILVYVIFFKLWEFLGATGSLTVGSGLHLQGFKDLFGHVLFMLFGLVLLSYVIGGIGLILMRAWSAIIVFYAAIIEAFIVLSLAAMLLYAVAEETHEALENLTVFSVLPVLFFLVIPAGIAYVARSLQKNPELWQRSQQQTVDHHETGRGVQSGMHQPAWIHQTFKLIIFTGLLLPAIMAFIVMNSTDLKGDQVNVSGFDLFIFILGTVLFALPYIILAFIARSVLSNALEEGGYKPVKRLFLIAGVFLGVTVFIAWNLFSYFQNTEGAAVLIFAPFVTIFAALPGVVAGAVVGLLSYFLWRHFR